MKLIIIRHGQTIQNANGIIQGQSEGILSLKGHKQVEKLGNSLKKTKINAIYSSDLLRTIQTASAILKYHNNLKLIKDKRLRERSFGKFENKKIPNNWNWNQNIKDIESNKNMKKRIISFIKEIQNKHKNNETIIIVTHGGTKRIIHEILQNKEYDKNNKIENTAISIYKLNKNNNHKMHKLNDTTHLKNPIQKIITKITSFF